MEKNPGETGLRHIVFCKCGGERIDAALLRDVDEYLGSVPVIVTRLSDLCGLAAKRKDELTGLLSKGSGIMVIGCHRRSMEIIFRQVSGENNPLPEFSHLDLINASFPEIAGKIDEFCDDSNGKHQFAEITEGSGWPAWYPVIDYSRCTSCGQCADFCLFGVYHKQEGLVKVTNPEYCKNNCPACARICPATAIIFPKYRHGGAIGGSEEIDEQAEHQRQARDIEQFLGNDIYQALQARKLKRQSIIRNEAMKKALSERDRARGGSEIT
jgi:NAD-dependent dihydropyrimidine dehydrogenase PreA subunit